MNGYGYAQFYASRIWNRASDGDFYSGDITVYAKDDCAADPQLERVAWYCFNSASSTRAVGLKEPNAWGLHDMLGNAMEWVNDPGLYSSPSGPVVDPGAAVKVADEGATRGGAFSMWQTLCRSANKHGVTRKQRSPGLGFRLVRTGP
ncbi:formylglycine-generating enzyme family protein [Archangium sp.]|uniref:formylglycine-generating enzyme family protein n=1 Tax=Archangium sp. TaxID=1872627 RepID=UPI002ED8F430